MIRIWPNIDTYKHHYGYDPDHLVGVEISQIAVIFMAYYANHACIEKRAEFYFNDDDRVMIKGITDFDITYDSSGRLDDILSRIDYLFSIYGEMIYHSSFKINPYIKNKLSGDRLLKSIVRIQNNGMNTQFRVLNDRVPVSPARLKVIK